MPRLSHNRVPKYRCHHASGRAVVALDGKTFYLGEHGTKASRAEYDRLIAEWVANGRRLPNKKHDVTVMELLDAFWPIVVGWHKPPVGVKVSKEARKFRTVLRPLRQLYGHTPGVDFGPLRLKTLRQAWVDAGLCRKGVNGNVQRIKRLFQWATENELLPPSIYHGLLAVKGLRVGRSEAPESVPVKPVPDADIAAVKPLVSHHIRAMIEVAELTGMRPSEISGMKGTELDVSGRLWIYSPAQHKTIRFGKERTIHIGPRAQRVLTPFLKTDLAAYLFDPRDADAERRAQLHAARKTPMSCGNKPGSNRKRSPMRKPREQYTSDSFRRAVHRACDRAGIARWSPGRLRHNAATMLRKEYGLEAARVILGHSSSAVTELYAEIDKKKAAEIMLEVG